MRFLLQFLVLAAFVAFASASPLEQRHKPKDPVCCRHDVKPVVKVLKHLKAQPFCSQYLGSKATTVTGNAYELFLGAISLTKACLSESDYDQAAHNNNYSSDHRSGT